MKGLDRQLETQSLIISQWEEQAILAERGMTIYLEQDPNIDPENIKRRTDALERIRQRITEERERADSLRDEIEEMQRINREDWATRSVNR